MTILEQSSTPLTATPVFDAIEARRSVKHYDPAFTMPQTDIDTLKRLAMLSPTSFNIQNWRFVLVQNPELRQKLRAAAWDQSQVTEASLLILICGDIKAWQKQPERYWANAPQAAQAQLIPMIQQFYEGRETVQRDEAMRSAGIAAQTLMLSAKAMGYDSCPMIGFDPKAVAELIQLPADHEVCMMLVIGKALKPANPRGGQLPVNEVWLQDTF
ncbi:MAG: nitroreductase family protein [Vampirovibrionales bacterium]|nr:nitroreductase family protein [Vampirovibrionales bacterium]